MFSLNFRSNLKSAPATAAAAVTAVQCSLRGSRGVLHTLRYVGGFWDIIGFLDHFRIKFRSNFLQNDRSKCEFLFKTIKKISIFWTKNAQSCLKASLQFLKYFHITQFFQPKMRVQFSLFGPHSQMLLRTNPCTILLERDLYFSLILPANQLSLPKMAS